MNLSAIAESNILPVTLGDLNTIKVIAKQAITASVIASDAEKQHIIEKSFKQQDAIFLKHHQAEEEILGFIIIQNFWNLSDVFVSPRAHNKGIGKALWLAAKNSAKEKIIRRIFVLIHRLTLKAFIDV